jgi:hypothetical protein
MNTERKFLVLDDRGRIHLTDLASLGRNSIQGWTVVNLAAAAKGFAATVPVQALVSAFQNHS